MNITQVKWNDRTPSFEEIKGKLILFTWNKEMSPGVIRIETRTHFDEYDWEGVSFSILSDEPVYCEWELDSFGVYKTDCGKSIHQFDYTKDLNNFCSYCGLPIRTVDELKPLPLLELPCRKVDGLEMKTKINWIRECPDFNQIEGCDILVKCVSGNTYELFASHCLIADEYDAYFDDDFIEYAVLEVK